LVAGIAPVDHDQQLLGEEARMRNWKFVPFVAIVATTLAGGLAVTPASAAEKPPYASIPAIRTSAHTRVDAAGTSRNWAGYAVTPTASTTPIVISVFGTWTQPTITCPEPNAAAYFWVGLDGWNNNTVEQIGSWGRCVNGNPVYEIWWEMYPDPPNIIRAINPGDVLTASVGYSPGANTYILSITNRTQQNGFSTVQTCPAGQTCNNNSAEWIAEAPGNPTVPLANYGQVTFSGASFIDANGATHTPNPGTPWLRTQITQASGGTTYATPGATSSDGRVFTVTWNNA
jgi:hypothetical protein